VLLRRDIDSACAAPRRQAIAVFSQRAARCTTEMEEDSGSGYVV